MNPLDNDPSLARWTQLKVYNEDLSQSSRDTCSFRFYLIFIKIQVWFDVIEFHFLIRANRISSIDKIFFSKTITKKKRKRKEKEEKQLETVICEEKKRRKGRVI